MKASIKRLNQSIARELRPHGTKTRYEQGCRCLQCRVAIADRIAERKASILARTYEFNGIVPANAARKHLRKLGRAGVGIRSVSEITGINKWKLSEIRAGRKPNIRAQTVQKILGVPKEALADGAQISLNETSRLIDQLVFEGFTKREIKRRLGMHPGTKLLAKEKVTAKRAMQVRKLYDLVMAA